MEAVVRLVLATYPMWWKERYGAETAELTEDLLADDGARHLRVLLNLVVGSVVAWVHYRRPARRPQLAGGPWGQVPDGGHRDVFGNRGLSARSLQDLEPDEVVLGVIDGWRRSPFLANYPPILVVMVVTMALTGTVVFHATPHVLLAQVLPLVVLLAVGQTAKVLTSSAPVAIAVTSSGLAVYRMRTYSRRSRGIVTRLPAAPPVVVRTGASRIKVDVGGSTFWVADKSLPLIRWMGGHAGGVDESARTA
jgi:hypothetical protein